jgi:hypothetical protein
MIIPNKHSGYQAGIRLYPTDGGGGGILPPPKPKAPWGDTQQSKGDWYNQQLAGGKNDAQIRADVEGNTQFGSKQSDSDWSVLAQTAGMQSPTGRPLAGSAQFYQPVYNSSYQNNNTGNSTNVSQYGQQLPAQQTSMFGGQMQGGGYGDYGMNNPFSPYSNSFLNIDQNLNKGTVDDKANMYRTAIQSGFGDQQIRNQATGLFGQQTPKDWGYLQGYAMGMTPGLEQQSEQDKIGFYQGARNQGFNDQTIRNAANQMIGNQTQSDWSYLQNKAGYGGGGYGNQFMPQMQTPPSYRPVQQQMQTPFSYQQPRSGYGGGGRNNFIPDAPLSEGMMGTMGGSGYDPMTGRVDLGTAGGSGQYTSQAFMPQMQSPFGYQSAQQQSMQSPFSYQSARQQPMQTPFSYQQSGYPSQPQPVYEYGRGVPQQSQTGYGYNQQSAMTPRPPMRPPVSYQPTYPSYGGADSQSISQNYYGYGQPIGSSMPLPTSYNQPVAPTYSGDYGTQLLAYTPPVSDYTAAPMPQYVSDTISDLDQYKSQPVQAYQSPKAKSSGPSQAIVGRSSQSRGTPNVMRRAEGGITSLMDDEE